MDHVDHDRRLLWYYDMIRTIFMYAINYASLSRFHFYRYIHFGNIIKVRSFWLWLRQNQLQLSRPGWKLRCSLDIRLSWLLIPGCIYQWLMTDWCSSDPDPHVSASALVHYDRSKTCCKSIKASHWHGVSLWTFTSNAGPLSWIFFLIIRRILLGSMPMAPMQVERHIVL